MSKTSPTLPSFSTPTAGRLRDAALVMLAALGSAVLVYYASDSLPLALVYAGGLIVLVLAVAMLTRAQPDEPLAALGPLQPARVPDHFANHRHPHPDFEAEAIVLDPFARVDAWS